jgi:ubiquinone/menaquinone biosynthesis C-methylase UbiE
MTNININTTKDFYWGVSDRETARAFIETSRKIGFGNALSDSRFEVFKKYATSKNRAHFLEYLPINKNSHVLDLGSGYGNITIPLASKVGKVCAADGTLELLEFSEERAISEGVANIEYYHVDPLDYCNLPFSPKQFDCIILNGVLEWIGTGDMTKKPDEIQESVLKYLNTLLKDDGVIYIGIENRFYPMYFYNIRDPHTKKMYTAILPRCISNTLMKIRGVKDGYRTYIYSFNGYKNLFRNAGFDISKLYLPLPSYREPHHMLDSDDRAGIKDAFKNGLWNVYHKKVFILLRFFYLLGLFKYTVHSFGFILKKYK